MAKLVIWSGNIINHFWDSCRTCEGDVMKLKVKYVVYLKMHIFQSVGKVGISDASRARCTPMVNWYV